MSHIDDGSLHAYADGECDARERDRIERHLSDCEVCRERLQEAERRSRRASELLAGLDPGRLRPPVWREIEERAAARSGGRRRRRWKPGLAWAASIAVAFALGWIANHQLGGPLGAGPQALRPPAASADRRVSEEGASAPDATPGADIATTTQQPPTAKAEAESGAGPPASANDGAEAGRADREGHPTARSGEPGPTAPARSEGEEKQVQRAAVDAGGETVEQRQEAVGLRTLALPSDSPVDRSTMAAPVSPSLEAATAETTDEPAADAELREQAAPPAERDAALADATGPVGFGTVTPERAEKLLGAPLRRFQELDLQALEAGPAPRTDRVLAKRPVVRLTYRDAADQRIVLLQQHAQEPAKLDDAARPALVVWPDGLRAYRWSDGPYRFVLVGRVSADSLRALAGRLQ